MRGALGHNTENGLSCIKSIWLYWENSQIGISKHDIYHALWGIYKAFFLEVIKQWRSCQPFETNKAIHNIHSVTASYSVFKWTSLVLLVSSFSV